MPTSQIADTGLNAPIFIAGHRLAKQGRALRVLLLANDVVCDQGVQPKLAEENCSVTRVSAAKCASELIAEQAFDAIVVDIRPDLLGYQAVSHLRLARVSLPVLFVSARSSTEAFAQAYAVGADDVTVLSSDSQDLKARLDSLVAEAKTVHRVHVLQVGPLELDIAGGCVRMHGSTLPLTTDEYAALQLMMSRNGAPVGKDVIQEQVSSETGNAETIVACLRRKLAQAGANDLIKTVWGIGYALREVRTTLGGCKPLAIAYAA